MKRIKDITKGLLVAPAIMLALGLAGPVLVADNAGALTIRDGADTAQGESQEGDASCLFGGAGCSGDGIFRTITNVLLFLIGAISVIMLIIGGIRYTISGGDSSQVTAAKNTILYAVVGLVVAILAYAIITFVLNQFAS